MTEKTGQYAEAHINTDYDTGETTISLRLYSDLELVDVYVLDSLEIQEKTRSTTKRKATEK